MNSVSDSVVAMPDVQSSLDTRHLPIQRVGVRGVRHPMLVAVLAAIPFSIWQIPIVKTVSTTMNYLGGVSTGMALLIIDGPLRAAPAAARRALAERLLVMVENGL